MVGNLFDPADSRTHCARHNDDPLGFPIKTRCDRVPSDHYMPNAVGPVDCGECLALGLVDDMLAALNRRYAETQQRPRPGELQIGRRVYATVMNSRALAELLGPRISFDGPGQAPLLGFPVREVDEVPADSWALIDDTGFVVASGVLGQLAGAGGRR